MTETDHVGPAATALSAPPPDDDAAGGSPGLPSALMPALPLSLGLAGGVLVLAVLVGTLYRKRVWPFRGRRQAADEVEGGKWERERERERRQGTKWDPRGRSRDWSGTVHF